MEKTANRKRLIDNCSKTANRNLGLLSIAFRCLLPSLSNDYKSMDRWTAAEKVAGKLKTNPLEILVLDVPVAMLPIKRKILIENPEKFFGENYNAFLRFTDSMVENDGKALELDPEIFTLKMLTDLDVSGNPDGSYRKIIEDKAQSDLRSNLPYFHNEKENINLVKQANQHNDTVAKKIKDGILAAFRELVEKSFPNKDVQYKERIALLAGLAAIEVLFVPKENHRFLPSFNSGR